MCLGDLDFSENAAVQKLNYSCTHGKEQDAGSQLVDTFHRVQVVLLLYSQHIWKHSRNDKTTRLHSEK